MAVRPAEALAQMKSIGAPTVENLPPLGQPWHNFPPRSVHYTNGL